MFYAFRVFSVFHWQDYPYFIYFLPFPNLSSVRYTKSHFLDSIHLSRAELAKVFSTTLKSSGQSFTGHGLKESANLLDVVLYYRP